MFKDGDRVYVPSLSESGTLAEVGKTNCVVRFDDGSTLPLALDKVTTVPTEEEVAEACRVNLALNEALAAWSKLPVHLAQIALRMERENS